MTALYEKLRQEVGPGAGRDIVEHGLSTGGSLTRPVIERSITVMRRSLAPPPSEVGSAPAASNESPQNLDSGGSGSLPTCTWQPESGGNPSAVNPESGAGGYYQIEPATWAANGGQGEPQNAPMVEQTRVAESVMRTQGPSAWVNC